MKKLLYITFLGLVGLIGFTRADIESLSVTPDSQPAISGSTLTFVVTGRNTTGDAYLKYMLPKTALYDVVYQNATLTPINNALLSLGIEHDPVFFLPAYSNFSVTITAKMITPVRSFSPITAQALLSSTMQMTPLLTSAIATITPIADLKITNILTGELPSYSGDMVAYYITLQNIGSATATGINFISTFPIPTLSTPTATFNGTPHIYSSINYPADFVWSGNYLNNINPGQTTIILMNAPMTQNFPVGTTFNHTAKITTISPEYTTGNNSALATGIVQTLPDVRVTTTLAPFTGYRQNDEVHYTIAYGNSGGKVANNVTITHTMNGPVTLNGTNISLGTLPAGSGGVLIITGTLNTNLTSGTQFITTTTISTTSNEILTGNNTAIVTGTIQGRANLEIILAINNLTRPQLDNAPYGSGPTTMIQAASGDILQVTITYTNKGNIIITHARLYLSGLGDNFISFNPFNGTIPNVIDIDESATVSMTGIIGPRNYISVSAFPYIHHDIGEIKTGNTVRIVEPLICGDGLLTRNEPCDTQGNLGVLYSGQVCENQQGQCVLRTNAIVNLACVNYQYPNPLGGSMITGQSCSSVNTSLSAASCVSLTGSAPTPTSNGYSIAYTCRGSNTTATTPITLNCGNGITISGTGNILNATCSYTGEFAGTVQCSVGNDLNNPLCRLPVNETQLQCDLEALDGRIILVDDYGEGEGKFRCETRNGVIAQTLRIDCGQNSQGSVTVNNASQVETICRYSESTVPSNKIVNCYTNGNICETENIIVDEGIFGRCGDGIVQGYEECDVEDMLPNRTYPWNDGQQCRNCRIVGNEAPVACFSLGGNNNLSVQPDEILPFRFAIDKKTPLVSSCTAANKNKVRAGSLMCDFAITNGAGDTVKTISLPCDKNDRSSYTIFNHISTIGKDRYSLQNAFGKYYTTLSTRDLNGIYGEHKLRLEQIQYEYCDGTGRKQGTPLDRVCDVNFTVTQPYLAQKSLFATTPKATDIRLEGYKMLDGTDLIKSTDLDSIMILDTSAYEGGNKVKAMINDFIAKYEKLALTVPQNSLKGTVFEGINDITVKVVPNKKIYILQASSQKDIVLKDMKKFTAPFTIVASNINITIKGNVEYNGMILVKNGTIAFEQADVPVNTTDRCPAPQTVKGIFVTDKGFTTPGALRNVSLNNKRCSFGNLYVKGILIGDNIQTLVNARRSHLNTWFSTKSTAETAIKSERRNKVFDGAAVLIEYSPSLRNALPPGASEFTKVLEIYKK